jgi:hypothetical protein
MLAAYQRGAIATPSARLVATRLLETLTQAGFTVGASADAYITVHIYVLGFVGSEHASRQLAARRGAKAPIIVGAAPASPALAAAVSATAEWPAGDRFQGGLDIIVAGIATSHEDNQRASNGT